MIFMDRCIMDIIVLVLKTAEHIFGYILTPFSELSYSVRSRYMHHNIKKQNMVAIPGAQELDVHFQNFFT